MPIHPLAGKPVPRESLVDLAQLERDYYNRKPDPADPHQQVSFGTSGHRGSPSHGTFTEAHILAIAQAICDHRSSQGITGPLYVGKDTHAVSRPAERTALEVFAANGVQTFIQTNDGFTPTPAVSHAILAYNRNRPTGLADGVVITPSHNPPADGGLKYNPPDGGPADTDVTDVIQQRANQLLAEGNRNVRRIPYERALRAPTTHPYDFVTPYIEDLPAVLDLDIIRSSGLRVGVDPLGGAGAAYWEPLRAKFDLNLTVVNPRLDPAFSFMTVDHDGKVRMDCSSPYAMAGLVQLRDQFDVAFGNDPDADRHGIVTRSAGLLNPNHYLAVAIRYLLKHRPRWSIQSAIGKTLVSSAIIDRVVTHLNRQLCEVPVGFKWFTPGLHNGSLCFGGEESAGASFLRHDGTAWVTDKDGLLLGLLAAEITARTGHDPAQHYQEIAAQFGTSYYTRIDAPLHPAARSRLRKLTPEAVTAQDLAGDPILAKLTRAPGNNESIGGLKVVSQHGWFAARPSGTENIYKLYAESFRSPQHLGAIVTEGRHIVSRALGE